MLNLLNAVSLFGLDPATSKVMLYLLIVQGILIIIEIAIFAILIVRMRRMQIVTSNLVEKERRLMQIDLDLDLVQRSFKTGEQFSCEGLVVNAIYSDAPAKEPITQFDVFTADDIKAREEEGNAPEGCYVLLPDTSNEGKIAVTVVYGEHKAVYMISVEQAEEIAEETPEDEVATEAVAEDVTEAVAEEATEEAAEEATEEVAEEATEEPATEVVTEVIIVEEAEEVSEDEEAEEAIEEEATEEATEETVEEVAEEPAEEGTEEVAATEEAATEENPIIIEGQQEVIYVDREPLFIEEDDRIRYDRSFTARLIQSDDETKHWYNELKNALLSYKKVKARMSWKRETYKAGRIMLARLSFRGKTLCLFLPLNPADFEDSKYKVEDASENSTYADTPCMYRIKNDRRVKYAVELIDMVMEQYGLPEIKREPEDYFMPYESLVALLNKGLIKRELTGGLDEEELRRLEQEAAQKEAERIAAEKAAEEEAARLAEEEAARLAEEEATRAAEEAAQAEIAAAEEQPAEEAATVVEEEEEAPMEYVEEPIEDEEDEDGEEDEDDDDDDEDEDRPKRASAAQTESSEDDEYDRSFRAMLIQSRDTTKGLYSDLKTELMSYKEIRSHLSWNYESYKIGDKRLVKFGFEDKTLCLYLATDPAAYADSRIRVEDASADEKFADTPAMVVLKNYDQYRFALEIIRKTMADNGAEKVPHKSVNYYAPRQSTKKLLEQGLIKKIEKPEENN